MPGNPWYVYLLGYVFGIVFAHFPISKTMTDLRQGIGIKGKEFGLIPWHTAALGMVERALYIASIQLGFVYVIAVWLALKGVGEWRDWDTRDQKGQEPDTESTTKPTRDRVPGRAIFNNFLIGSGLSLAYAIAAAVMLKHWPSAPAFWAPGAVLAGNVLLWIFVVVAPEFDKQG